MKFRRLTIVLGLALLALFIGVASSGMIASRVVGALAGNQSKPAVDASGHPLTIPRSPTHTR